MDFQRLRRTSIFFRTFGFAVALRCAVLWEWLFSFFFFAAFFLLITIRATPGVPTDEKQNQPGQNTNPGFECRPTET
jgi:hypothetical protein